VALLLWRAAVEEEGAGVGVALLLWRAAVEEEGEGVV